ncbi:MAG: S-layer homology domain-containing protein [Acutalibacter sp.]|nr:S-layer homology domain-containing protein [Acutalibacter sp.]
MKKALLRFTSGIISLILIVSISVNACAMPAFVDDVDYPITDCDCIPAWYARAVYYLWYAHVVDESRVDEEGRTLYEPARAITRGQFLSFLGHLAEQCGKEVEQESVWELSVKDCLKWAVKNHIAYGKGNGLGENDTLTRQEMAVFLKRFAEYIGFPLDDSNTLCDYEQLMDSDKVAPWAEESLQYVHRYRIMVGEEHEYGSFFMNPRKTVTRAEAAQAIFNYVESSHFDLPFYGADVGEFPPPSSEDF